MEKAVVGRILQEELPLSSLQVQWMINSDHGTFSIDGRRPRVSLATDHLV